MASICMFENMSRAELRAWINGCHASKQYDSYFEAACRVFNDRHRDVALTPEQFSALQRYAGKHGRTWKSELSIAPTSDKSATPWGLPGSKRSGCLW